MEIAELIELLSRPDAYPHVVEKVEVRQTHISAVFLAGPFVYKIKKPVTLPFVDFSTLEKRRHFCVEEIHLNRRLAPAVYLGVVPVLRTTYGARFGELGEWERLGGRGNKPFVGQTFLSAMPEGGQECLSYGEVIEWAVKMRRLPDSATLHERLKPDQVDVNLVDARRPGSHHFIGLPEQ